MGDEQAVLRMVTDVARNRFIVAIFAVVLVGVALYFGRLILEPVAFVLFTLALVEPFRKAAEARAGKPLALALTVILCLLVISLLVGAIVWSLGDIVHWGLANVERFQSLYQRTMQWLQEKDLFVGDLESLSSFSFVSLFQKVAGYTNSLLGFALVVFLFLAFGLAEMEGFKSKLSKLDEKMSGWSLLETSGQIAEKIRKYMLIRSIASAATGVAVFLFTLSIGLELAVAWGVLAFVLNFIPYIGSIVAVILPVIFSLAQFESLRMAVLIFGCLYGIQFVIGSYLEPVLTGKSLAISPFVMLLAFLIWDVLWGMPGSFIGLPVTIALYTIWEQNPSTRWIADLMSGSTEAPEGE